MAGSAASHRAVRRAPELVDARELQSLAEASDAGVLAVVCFGAPGTVPLPWLTSRIPGSPLVDGVCAEVWPAASTVERFDDSGVAAAADGSALFAALAVDEIDDDRLEAMTFDAYHRLLDVVRRAHYPHLVRMWNFVPGINLGSGDRERYKLFCTGRSKAFRAHAGETFPHTLPAASAVGCAGNTLLIQAIAARHPGQPVENPRQVSAYRYPERYGPTSPTFARGMKAPPPWTETLFVSGTASIAGHESRHRGDPGAQASETLTNIEAVLDASGVDGRGAALGERIHQMRVYVRHERHFSTLRDTLERHVGRAVKTVWLQAEICRSELLVEIEATVLAPTP